MLSKQHPFIAAALVAASQAQQTLYEPLFLNDDESQMKQLSDVEVANTTYPGDLCCSFYDNADFGGKKVDVCLPTADWLGEKVFQMNDYGLHDKMSSWWCGKSVSYDLCSNTSGSCTGNDGMSGAGNARSSQAGHNDSLDRVVLRYYDASEQGAVVTFHDADCRSDAGRFDTTTDPTRKVEYNNSEMYERNVKNDSISSVMVPQGYSVMLYSDNGFRGSTKTINGGNWTSVDQQMQCQNVSDFGDKTSSLAVYRTELGLYSIGDWVSITTTESVDFTYHVGFTTTQSTEQYESSKYSLSMQMQEGMKFMGFSEQETITESYEQTISFDTKSSMEQDISIDVHIPCTGSIGAEGGVGLWQYVVHNGRGIAKGIAYTGNTVCRYGDLYNVKPACPWNACIGGDCSSCKTDWNK